VIQRHPPLGPGREWVPIAARCRRVLCANLIPAWRQKHAARFPPAVLEDPASAFRVIWESSSSRRGSDLDYPYPGSRSRSTRPGGGGIDSAAGRRRGRPVTCSNWCRLRLLSRQIPISAPWRWPPMEPEFYYDLRDEGQISRLRSGLGRMVPGGSGRDARPWLVELQGAGVIAAGIEPGRCAVWCGVKLLNDGPHSLPSPQCCSRASPATLTTWFGQPFACPSELIFVMRALSTFEGIGRGGPSLDDFGLPAPTTALMTRAAPRPQPTSSTNWDRQGRRTRASRPASPPPRRQPGAHRTRRTFRYRSRRRKPPPLRRLAIAQQGQRSSPSCSDGLALASSPSLAFQRPPAPQSARGLTLLKAPGQTATRWPHR